MKNIIKTIILVSLLLCVSSITYANEISNDYKNIEEFKDDNLYEYK